MVMEVPESNMAVSVDSTNENIASENGKVNITFGSHGTEEPAKVEVAKVPDASFPKDAVDEWPEPEKVYSFYMVKYRPHEDKNLKAKLDVADKDLQKKNQARSQIVEKMKAKRAERRLVIDQLVALGAEKKQYRAIMDEKKKEREPLQQALGKLQGGGGRDRGSGICSSEEELNRLIKSLQYRIQHESIPLNEEKQILREIKQLEGTREQVIANAAERARIQEAMGEKEAIQDQYKLIGADMDGVRKEKDVVVAKIKQLDEEKVAIEKEIMALDEELTAITQKRDKAFESIQEMRKQREEGNTPFYQNRVVLTKAKELAAKKNIEALKEMSNAETDKFISLWSTNKAFRDDYQKRILTSLDMRQLSRDGRLRNPNEKPLVSIEAPAPTEKEVAVKANVKVQSKENVIPPVQEDASSVKKVQKEKVKETGKKEGSKVPKVDLEEADEVFEVEKPKKEPLKKKDEVDEAKLKEIKREEEIAKAKQAMERKKKLAEKAAAKAAIKAQKEAEKKLKEREKRAKKKAGGAGTTQETEEPSEEAGESTEPEKVEEKAETPALPPKTKDRKDSAVRTRARPRGPDSLPKAILKRKKATNYWLWAGPAVAVILVLLAVGYTYVMYEIEK